MPLRPHCKKRTFAIRFGRIKSKEQGQTLGEYALILTLIVIVAVVVLALVGNQVVNLLMRAANSF